MKTNIEIARKCGAVIERTSEHWQPAKFSVCFPDVDHLDVFATEVIATYRMARQGDAACFCDQQGIGKPGVTCGDCPRDYAPALARRSLSSKYENNKPYSVFGAARKHLVCQILAVLL